MKNLSKKLKVTFALMLIATLVLSPLAQVKAAYVSEKTVTVTLTKKKPSANYSVEIADKYKVPEEEIWTNTDYMIIGAKVEILSAKGKAKEKKIYWGTFSSDGAKGSLFQDLKTKKIKKKAKLKMTYPDDGLWGSGGVSFYLPEGMKKIKMKVTFFTQDGTKAIKSVKKTKEIY